MPVIGLRAEMAGKPGELRRRRVRHVGIDGDLDEVGSHHVAAGFEDDGERRERRLQLVGTEIGQQTAHEAAVVDFAGDVIVLRGFFRGLLLGSFGFCSSAMCVTILDGYGRRGIPNVGNAKV